MFKIAGVNIDKVDDICDLYYYHFNREPGLQNIERLVLGYPSVSLYDGDNLVGFALTDFLTLDSLKLDTVLVREDYRGRGLGSRMLEELKLVIPPPWKGILATDSGIFQCNGRQDNSTFFKKNRFLKIAQTGGTKLFFCCLE